MGARAIAAASGLLNLHSLATKFSSPALAVRPGIFRSVTCPPFSNASAVPSRHVRAMGSTPDGRSDGQQNFLNGKDREEGISWADPPHPNWQPGEKQPNPWGSTTMVRDPVGSCRPHLCCFCGSL